jgi:hypothetical protein
MASLGNNGSTANSLRSDFGGTGSNMFVPEVKNLYPASKVPANRKDRVESDVSEAIWKQLKRPNGSTAENNKIDAQQMKYSNQLAFGMVRGDNSNGLEDYFPKGMNTEFINALAKSGYIPSFEDKDTIMAVGKIVDARIEDDAKGVNRDFSGQFHTFVEQKKDGYHLGIFTSEYRGRDGDGEKTYKESDVKTIMVIPHDEVSNRITSTKISATPTEIYNSKSYVKAHALRNYLDALLMTSNF